MPRKTPETKFLCPPVSSGRAAFLYPFAIRHTASISFFASADGSQTSESNFSKEAISEKQDDTDAEKEATPTSSATPTPSPDVSEQPVLSESEQTKTSEKSDLTTKEAREQMQIDQMEDDSADHPEE